MGERDRGLERKRRRVRFRKEEIERDRDEDGYYVGEREI